MTIVHMSAKGQIVVPKGARDRRGFGLGTAFAFLEAKDGDLIFRPVKKRPKLSLIEHLTPPEQQELVGAVSSVEALLETAPVERSAPPAETVELRPPRPGDLGWVVMRHGELYAQEYGWNEEFERLVAGIVGGFATGPAGPVQQCWIAALASRRAGSVFLMPGPEPDVGRLRLLLVEPWARGQGVGRALIDACIEAARAAGCRRLTLWTNDVLTAARRLYERAGFRLVHSERHQSFGKLLVGQTWDLDL